MSSSKEVSVIVCTYNPNWEKYKLTLLSIVNQQKINIEIIICDDASDIPLFDKVKDFFELYNFTDYIMLGSDSNQGIVKNLYKGLIKANGKYIYGISPGDFFYNDKTLCNLYDFVNSNNSKVCFGNTLYYKNCNDGLNLADKKYSNPENPWIFSNSYDKETRKCEFFFCGGFVLGASFLRERTSAIYYFEKIIGVCKYIEDNTTLALQIYDDIEISHYDNYVVVYEYGSGVSTSGNKKWADLLHLDWVNFYKMMHKQYPNDKYISAKLVLNQKCSKYKKFIEVFKISPLILYKIICGLYFKPLIGSLKANKDKVEYSFINKIIEEANSQFDSWRAPCGR